MPENKSRFVLLCQQAFSVAVVGAVAASAVAVTELEIVPPGEGAERTLVAAAPVEPTVRSVPLEETGSADSSESRTGGAAAQEIETVSEAEPVVGYATVGVTWDAARVPAEDAVSIELRTYEDGAWSSWQEMHYDADHGPDPGSPEARGKQDTVRNGTEPVVVGDVDDVQVRATTTDGEPLDGLELDIVDPGAGQVRAEAPRIDTSTLSSYSSDEDAAALAAGIPSKPTIYTRAQWGADEKLRGKSVSYGKIRTGFVHHTVNANNYTQGQVPQILRGIYAYHTKSRGWSDVGYNFLVDRFGRIWEGRYGGVDKAVVGAHTYGYNSSSFAMSAIGNFETAQAPTAMVTAYGSLMGWKLALHGVDATATKIWVNDRYFQSVNGHRDAGSTACPGRYLYAQLPAIRKRAVWLQQTAKNNAANKPSTPPANQPTTPPANQPANPVLKAGKPGSNLALDVTGDRWPDLVVRDKRSNKLMVVPTGGQLAFAKATAAKKSWKGADLVVSPGDLDRDGLPEVMVRIAKSGVMTTYAGTRTGAAGRVLGTTSRFATVDQLTGVGDFNGDGKNDIVGRTGLKRLALFLGRGDGSFGAAKILATDWKRYQVTAGVDDLDGDGRPDLVARSSSALHLVPGKGTSIAAAKTIKRPGSNSSWGSFDVLTGRGDLTGDGRPDVVARLKSSGKVYVYPGNGKGQVSAPLGAFSGFEKQRWLTAVDQVKADNHPDLVGLDTAGRLAVAAHAGTMNLGQPVDTGVVLTGVDLVINAGDWNRDGRGDVITRRTSDGALQLRAGTGAGKFAAPVTLRKAPGGLTRLAAVGDMNGDGFPDLVGTIWGKDVLFPNVGGKSMGTTKVYRSPVPGSSEAGVSHWDGDGIPDTVVRDDRTLRVWPSKTGKAATAKTLTRDYTWVLGLGDLDGDGRADLVGRTGGGSVYLLPGTSAGFGSSRLMGGGFGAFDLGS